MKRLALLSIFLMLSLGAVGMIHVGRAAPTGTSWDHIVVIAMENQPYSAVMGSGTGTGSTPFLSSLLGQSYTNTFFGGYGSAGRSINGCSAGCYAALISGSDQGVSDGNWGAFGPVPTVIDKMNSAGLTWQAYCESGCPRGNDHFPFTASNSISSSPNLFTSGSVSTSSFVSAANSANPPNFLWYTPTDNNNMHDNSVNSGDSYLQSFLVGSGSVSSPGSGSLLASNVFRNTRTLLVLWWDEPCGNSGCGDGNSTPNLYYGTSVTRKVSTSNAFDTYSLLRLIEDNWGLPTLAGNDATATGLKADVSVPCASNCNNPLSATITYNPTSPTPGVAVTFTGSASGGTGPYRFTWSGGVTSTTNPVTTNFAAGTYTVNLSIQDSGAPTQTATASVTVTVSTGGGGGGGTKPTSWPHLLGWGGARLDEAAVGAGGVNANHSTQASAVFVGETVTNMELLMIREKQLGYNTVRVSFDPTCSDNTDVNYMSAWSAANFQRVISLAKYYNMWIVLDYHGYTDIEAVSTGLVVPGYPTLQACWLGTWAGIVSQFKNSYTQLIWEALNEPSCGTPGPGGGGTATCGQSDLDAYSAAFQAWITQDRNTGDDHWIVVGNICSNACTFSDYSLGYETVTDPIGRVFTSLHSYFGYPYTSQWTNSGADAYAQTFYNAVLSGYQKTGWPALNTEGGADPLCAQPACPGAGWVTAGSAGYTSVSYEFILKLTTLYNTANPPINWIWWTAGSWTDTPTNLVLGALDTIQSNGQTEWGTLLGPQTIGSCTTLSSSGCGSGGTVNLFYQALPFIAGASILGVLGVLGATVSGRKRGRPA
jgi:phosphatidylinositol-3-phosphatase